MAQILDKITVGEFCIIEIDTDPRTSGGTAAELGSIAVLQPSGGTDIPTIFQKTGSGDIDWVQYDSGTRTINKPAHGFTLTNNVPLPAYFDSGTGLTLSQADDIDTLKAIFITKIIDANTVEIKHSGIHYAPSHGLNQGSYYFLSQTVAGDVTDFNFITGINDPVFFVVDSDTLLLLDNRAIDQDSFNDYYIKLANTNTATNINVTGTEVPLNGTVVTNENSNQFVPSGNGVQVLRDGTYKIWISVHMFSTATRPSTQIRLAINGTPLANSPIGASGYIRDTSGHQESSAHIFDQVPLSANDIITVETIQEAGAGTVTMAAVGTSTMIVEAK